MMLGDFEDRERRNINKEEHRYTTYQQHASNILNKTVPLIYKMLAKINRHIKKYEHVYAI